VLSTRAALVDEVHADQLSPRVIVASSAGKEG